MSSLDQISYDDGAFCIENAQAHLSILRVFCVLFDALGAEPASGSDQVASTDYYLSVIDYRYRLYLDLLVTLKDVPQSSWPHPPWDVALMMHSHLLSPVKFSNDISSSPQYNALAGKIDFPLIKLHRALARLSDSATGPETQLWRSKYPGDPYTMICLTHTNTSIPRARIADPFRNRAFSFNTPPPFSLDLGEAVKRQMAFARKITSIFPHDPVPHEILRDSQQRYVKFMNLVRLNAVRVPVPALDIDLYWHTHQLCASNYLSWCTHHVGRPLDHNDTIEAGHLSTGLDDTVAAWGRIYSEDYLSPGSGSGSGSGSSFPRDPSATDRVPPPSLTAPQLKLWRFDAEQQIAHEQLLSRRSVLVSDVNYKLERLAAYDRPSDPKKFSRRAQRSGFMKGLLNVLPADNGHRKALESSIEYAQKQVQECDLERRHCREEWGRQRWPLLVAARGFGDSSVTAGRHSRPAQGSSNLDFPIYPATWYHDRESGYNQYINRGHTTVGGSVSGAQCGGRFDGGNCVAAPAPRRIRNNEPMCGGGCAG